MRKVIIGTLLSVVGAGLLTSCNTMQVPNDADQTTYIRVGTGYAPRGCEYRGEVNSGSVEYMPIETHGTIQANQIALLRSQAYHLGANAVIVTLHNTSYYGQYIVPTGDTSYGIDSHAMAGQAYYCPPYALHQVRLIDREKVSDVRAGG